MGTITKQRLTKNLLISVFVQCISLAVSLLLNFAVPKFISEVDYAHWQSYVLYVSYVGVLHFGLLDGLVLRYAQYDYNVIDKRRVRSTFLVLTLFTSLMTAVATVTALLAFQAELRIIIILVAVGVVSKNLVTYTLYTFQITNRISRYAILVALQKVIYGIGVVILIACGVQDFVWYCVADLAGDVLGVLIMSLFNRGMYFGRVLAPREMVDEIKENISAGIFLMLATWSSMLLLSGAKLVAQWHWEELVFGKIAYAFSGMNLFFIFVTAISVVLFPALKRIDKDTLPTLYGQIRSAVTLVLVFAMLFYFPACYILELWLPAYAISLKYLGILLPVVIFSSKVSLLTNNYMKVYRKERQMLLLNAISVLLGLVAFLVSAFIFDNVYALLVSMVIVIMFNSILSEVVVMRHIGVRLYKDFILEAAVAVALILITALVPHRWVGMLIYLGVLILYCLLNLSAVKAVAKKLFARLKRTPGEDA